MVSLFYGWFFVVSLLLPKQAFESTPSMHPFYVSVTEINHNSSDRSLEVSCKIFTDDFEKGIETALGQKVNLFRVSDTLLTNRLIHEYMGKALQVTIDGKPYKLEFVGFERESEAIWSYYQVSNVSAPKRMDINNRILYESFEEQINLLHVTVNGQRQSTKLNNPSSAVTFNFR